MKKILAIMILLTSSIAFAEGPDHFALRMCGNLAMPTCNQCDNKPCASYTVSCTTDSTKSCCASNAQCTGSNPGPAPGQ